VTRAGTADAGSAPPLGAVWGRACSRGWLRAQGAPAGEAHADSRAAGESAASSGAPGGGSAAAPPPPGGHASPASDAAAGQDRAGAGADAAAAPANGHAPGGCDDARERGRDRRRDRDSGDGRGRRRDSGRARDGDRDADKRGRGEDARSDGGAGGAGGGELSARQRARMADLSLLLEVVLRTSAGGARREFCRCGVLHQLQAVLGRCLSGQYAVVLRKLLRCAEALPFGADDLHTAASAHGSFADVLKQLAVQHADVEARPGRPRRACAQGAGSLRCRRRPAERAVLHMLACCARRLHPKEWRIILCSGQYLLKEYWLACKQSCASARGLSGALVLFAGWRAQARQRAAALPNKYALTASSCSCHSSGARPRRCASARRRC